MLPSRAQIASIEVAHVARLDLVRLVVADVNYARRSML